MVLDSNITFDNTAVAFASKTDRDLQNDYLMFQAMNNQWLSKTGTFLIRNAFKINLPIDGMVRKTVFRHFCGGVSINDCESTIMALADYGIGTILDYAVEGEDTEEDYDRTVEEILRTIDRASKSKEIPFSVFKPTGIANKVLLEKVQSGNPLSERENSAYKKVMERFLTICEYAFNKKVRILVDSEDSWYQQPVDELVYDMMRKFNLKEPIVFNTYQMYRVGMMDNLRRAFHYAATYNYFLGVKLVRGAYMEKERKRANELDYKDPIMPDKGSTDNQYDQALKFCIDNKQRIALCSGSHNEDSNQYLALLMEKHSMKNNDERVFFAQLYGMSDHISYNLAKAGYNVVKYVPYGPVKAVLPYLFRRAEENTSVAGQSSRELSLIRQEMDRRKNS
jgi:proline dehydrogenase